MILLSNGKLFEKHLVAEATEQLMSYTPEEFSATLKNPSSLWKVSSALQKAVRRGLTAEAIKYTQALFNGGQAEYFWRRLPVIVMEDIGPGNYELCATVLAFCRFAEYRKSFPAINIACWLIEKMCGSIKSRSLTDVLCLVDIRAAHNHKMLQLVQKTDPKALVESLSINPMDTPDWKATVIQQAFVARRLMGDRSWEGENKFPIPPREPGRTMFYSSMEANLLELEMYCLWAGQKKAVHSLNDSVVPLHHLMKDGLKMIELNVLPEIFKVGGVIEQAFDQHNQEGKRSLAYFAKSYEPVREFLQENGITDSVKVLGMMVFHVESGVLDRQLKTAWADELQAFVEENECVSVGLSPEGGKKLKELISSPEAREALRLARLRVVEGKESQLKYLYG